MSFNPQWSQTPFFAFFFIIQLKNFHDTEIITNHQPDHLFVIQRNKSAIVWSLFMPEIYTQKLLTDYGLK